MSNLFFSSDTHFGSERTLSLSRRPFASTNEMDEAMVKIWNETVAPNDTVYHVGDFGDIKMVKRLNGKIILILGNYEIKDINEGILSKEELLAAGFEDVVENLTIDNFNEELPEIKKIFITHEPKDCIIDDEEYFNLFGHIHGRQLVKKFGLDVGVDGHHFRPVSEKDVCFYMTAIKKFYDENVFM